jgi:hypothetical protein
MFSSEFYPGIEQNDSCSIVADVYWRALCEQHHLQAALVLRVEVQKRQAKVQWAYNVPIEPFNGADATHVAEAANDAFAKHPAAHVHGISNMKLPERLHRHNQNIQPPVHMWFYPIGVREKSFVFLGFPRLGEGKQIPADLNNNLLHVVLLLSVLLENEEIVARLNTTEMFVKEVGHDLASSVQASIAKLHNLVEGRITGDGVRSKAKEIENEIWSAYRVADSLGIVVDPNYQLRQPDDFDIVAATETVITRFASEAEEKHTLPSHNGRKPFENPWFYWVFWRLTWIFVLRISV